MFTSIYVFFPYFLEDLGQDKLFFKYRLQIKKVWLVQCSEDEKFVY